MSGEVVFAAKDLPAYFEIATTYHHPITVQAYRLGSRVRIEGLGLDRAIDLPLYAKVRVLKVRSWK